MEIIFSKADVVFICPCCGKEHYLYDVPLDLIDRLKSRFDTGEHIQDILANYNKFDREKFVTEYCDDCQKKIFGYEEAL